MIRKEFHEGLAYSVVETDGLRRVFAMAQPCCGNTFEEQIAETLESLSAIFRQEEVGESMLMQTVFLKNIENQPRCREVFREFYGQYLPATAYIAQPPCEGSQLAIEAWGIVDDRNSIEIKRLGEDLVLARHEGIDWAYLINDRPDFMAATMYSQSLATFQSACARLQSAGVEFNDVIRTWLYLGGITDAEQQTSRYLELNRARADYYRDRKFGSSLVPCGWNKAVYPASTGIGMNGRDLTLGCLAVKTQRSDVRLLPLENPQQTAAYDYAHQYGPESPKFARAMALVAGESVATFISGTASITASDTRHADDFGRQAQQTLDNIEVLISRENYAGHGFPNMGATFDDLVFARVYLKRTKDIGQARSICQKRLDRVPTIYTVADVCREELLIEIEALAYSRRQSTAEI